MAGVEKITYLPLVTHLQGNAEFYNQVYFDYEFKYGSIDKNKLSTWIVRSIEPIVREVTANNHASLPDIFRAFYLELLKLSSSGLAVTYEKEYEALWNLCNKIPSIVIVSPSQVLKSLNNALQTIRRHQPAMTLRWIELMNETVSSCVSIEDLFNCGRINAWLCGLAHLREKCKRTLLDLSPAMKSSIEKSYPLSMPLENFFGQLWVDKEQPQFIKEAGGFVGFGGEFTEPPLLGDGGNYVLAMDKQNAYVLFADEFGRALLPCSYSNITPSRSMQPLKDLRKNYKNELAVYADISSCLIKDNTLFLTRYSSHYIYIYGWSYGNQYNNS